MRYIAEDIEVPMSLIDGATMDDVGNVFWRGEVIGWDGGNGHVILRPLVTEIAVCHPNKYEFEWYIERGINLLKMGTDDGLGLQLEDPAALIVLGAIHNRDAGLIEDKIAEDLQWQ